MEHGIAASLAYWYEAQQQQILKEQSGYTFTTNNTITFHKGQEFRISKANGEWVCQPISGFPAEEKQTAQLLRKFLGWWTRGGGMALHAAWRAEQP